MQIKACALAEATPDRARRIGTTGPLSCGGQGVRQGTRLRRMGLGPSTGIPYPPKEKNHRIRRKPQRRVLAHSRSGVPQSRGSRREAAPYTLRDRRARGHAVRSDQAPSKPPAPKRRRNLARVGAAAKHSGQPRKPVWVHRAWSTSTTAGTSEEAGCGPSSIVVWRPRCAGSATDNGSRLMQRIAPGVARLRRLMRGEQRGLLNDTPT